MLTALYALLFTLLLTVSHAVKAMKTFLRVTWAQVVAGAVELWAQVVVSVPIVYRKLLALIKK